MDFGSNLEDDFFENVKEKSIKQAEKYTVKVCEAEWFTNDTGSPDDGDLSLVKFQADLSYFRKCYEESRHLYRRCLDGANNSTVRRDCSEAIVRCCLKLGLLAEALQYATLLFQESTNLNQKSIASNLLALVHHKSENYTEEILCLQTCIIQNEWNADLWIRLAICYANIDKISIPTTCGNSRVAQLAETETATMPSVCPEAHRFDEMCSCCCCTCQWTRSNKSHLKYQTARIFSCVFRSRWLFLSCQNGHRSFSEKRNYQAQTQLSRFLIEMGIGTDFTEKVRAHMIDDTGDPDSSKMGENEDVNGSLQSPGFEKKWFGWIEDEPEEIL